MTQAILCPQCEKRFTLPQHPPAQATCTQCGTLMDLTAFGGSTVGGRGTVGRGSASARSPARSSRRRSRRRSRPGGRQGGEGRAGGRQTRERATSEGEGGGMLLLLVGALIVVLFIVVAVKSGGDDEGSEASAVAPAPGGHEASLVSDIPRDVPLPPPAKTARVPRVPRSRNGKPRLSRLELRTLDWPESVDAATRARAEASILTLYKGGRDAIDARDWLVKQGRPIAGRLISEFRAIEQTQGFDNREGASMAATIDGTLRRIDGQIERFWEEREQIRAWGLYAAPSFITRTAKRWTWWWIEDEWKARPRAPWDPTSDESDTAPDGIKRPDAKKKDGKKGWSKRAGSG